MLRRAWRKWVLFICAAPFAVAGNMARILMLTIGTMAFGTEFALGKNPLTEPSWFHLAAGYLVFIVALLGMMGIASLLNRNWDKITGRWKDKSGASPRDRPMEGIREDLY